MSSNQLPPPNLVRQPTGRIYAGGLFPELTSLHANPPTTSTIDEAALFASLASPTRSSPPAPPPPPPTVAAPTPPFDYLSYLNDETPVMSEVVDNEGPSTSSTASAHQFLCATNADPHLRALVTSTPSPKTLADEAPSTPKMDIADIAVMIKSLEAAVERVLPSAESAVKKSASQKSLARSRAAADQRSTQHRITLIEEGLVHIRDNASHATRKVHTEVRNLAAEFTRTNQRLDNVVALLHKNKSSLK